MLSQIRLSLLIACALLICSMVRGQTQEYDRRPRTASISGRVLVKGEPAPNITVTAAEIAAEVLEVRLISLGGREFVDPYSYRATTDSEGRYQIGSLPAGQYTVSPRTPAHVTKSTGRDTYPRITLDEGEIRENVDLTLVPGGVITGRVTDKDGRPQIGRYVRLLELTGPDQWVEVQKSWDLETDDRGVFRIFGLKPGRYIARTGGRDAALRGALNGKETELTYHPDVVRQEDATVIDVTEGGEVTGVDIRLRDPLGKTFAASGRVVNAETGKPMLQVTVNCFQVENQDQEWGNGRAEAITDAEGNFIATGLRPGKYKARVYQREGDEYFSESKYFEVHDVDVGGIDVRLRRGATISGMVIIEEGVDPNIQARLSQTRLNALVNAPNRQTLASLRSKINSDGSFRLTGLPPGIATIWSIRDETNAIHLLRVERNGVELSEGLRIDSVEEIKGVRVIVGVGGGSIRGLVKVIRGTLPQGVHVAVNVQRVGSLRIGGSAEVDEKGRFLIKGLLTGEYDLFVSWGTRNYIRLDPDFKIPQPPKQRVSVTNGAESSLSLTIDLGRKE